MEELKQLNVSIRESRLRSENNRKDKIKKWLRVHNRAILYFVLIFWAIACLFPFVWAVIAPFNRYDEVATLGLNPIPKHWTTDNYEMLFQNETMKNFIGQWMRNSLIYSTLNATLNVFFNFLAGYALARISFKSKNMIFWYLIAGTTIPAQITQIPQLIILIKMGVIGAKASDTSFFMGIIFTGMTSATWVFMARQYYLNVGVSAEEAGALDGLSTFGTFFRISLKQMIPLMATMWALIFMAGWNNFIMFTLWAGGMPERMNMTAGLKTIGELAGSQANATPALAKVITLTATNIAVLPVIVIYMISLYFQRKQVIEGEK